MEKFLYTFDYVTPTQKLGNAKHGWDDMNEDGFFILADEAEAARNWGDALANRYVQILYNNPDITLKSIGHAGNISTNKEQYQACEQAPRIQTVTAGVYPDIAKKIAEKYKNY
jgi:hypothetical protein